MSRFISFFLFAVGLISGCSSNKQLEHQKMLLSLKDTVYAQAVEPEIGAARLQSLLQTYPDLKTWAQRRECLRAGLWSALGLNPKAKRSAIAPLYTGQHSLSGYTVENVAFECVPGVWVIGNIYRPQHPQKTPCPAVLLPHGHFGKREPMELSPRISDENQRLAATLANMGVIVFTWDMFGYGESAYHAGTKGHDTSLAQIVQTWSSLRCVDFISSLPDVDVKRIGMTGASGGGTQTFLAAALDERIAISVPAIQVSCFFPGGCTCESGCPIHRQCEPHSNNAEIAALAAPRPQLIISDGKDWTRTVPEVEYPYIHTIYQYYGKGDLVENFHIPNEGHDNYGYTKRCPMYRFFAAHLGLDLAAVTNSNGQIDESGCTILDSSQLAVFPNKQLPSGALHSLEDIYKAFLSLR